MPKHLLSRASGVLLLGLLLIFSVIAWNRDPQGVTTQQAASGACLSARAQGFVFEFAGYVHNEDGTTTLTYSVTNPNKKDISYVAFGTVGWSRLEPSDGMTATLTLGTYQVEWTNSRGNPGFTSVKYETQFGGFSKSATDTFTLVVSGFDPAATVQVEAKAGRDRGRVSFALGDPACDKTPPTPTLTPPFSPLPTPTPDLSLTLYDYDFGKPQVVLSSTNDLWLMDILPDSESLLIVSGVSDNSEYDQIFQTYGINTNRYRAYGNTVSMQPRAIWLNDEHKLAFLRPENGTRVLYLSTGGESMPSQVAIGNFRGAIAGRDGQVMVLEAGAESPLLYDSEGNLQSLPQINILSDNVNQNAPHGNFINMRWHPFDSKIAIFDNNGFIILNITTGQTISYDLANDNRYWGFDAQWSPDGTTMGIIYAEGLPVFDQTYLGTLDMITGELQNISIPVTGFSDITWAANGRQFLVIGITVTSRDSQEYRLYMVDSSSGEIRELTQLDNGILRRSYPGTNLSWSPDGKFILFRCQLAEDVYALCKSDVTVGGEQ